MLQVSESKIVNRLLDRYKKSQFLLENAYTNSVLTQNSPSQPIPLTVQTQSPFSNQEFPSMQRNNHKRYKKTQKMFDEDYDSSSREKHRQKQTIEQISQLRDTISLKDVQNQQKSQRTVLLNKQLKVLQLNPIIKQTLRDYIDRTQELERKVQQKEQVLRQYEDETKEAQENVQKSQIQIKEMKLKEDNQVKLLDEVKTNFHLMRTKLAKKKEKLKTIKNQSLIQQQQFDEQGYKFSKELERVQKLCEEFSMQINEQEQRNIKLEQEVISLRDQLAQKEENTRFYEATIMELRQRDQDQCFKLESDKENISNLKNEKLHSDQITNQMKQQILNLEQQQVNIQRQYQEELNKVSRTYENDNDKKKEKVASLKQILNEKEQTILQLQKEIDYITKETEISGINNEQKLKEIENACQANGKLQSQIKELENKVRQQI